VWTLARIPRLLATYEFGTATSAHGSCKLRPVRLRRIAHFFPHTRPPDTHAQFSPQHTTFTHALEVGAACLANQRLLVNPYCTFDLCRPRGLSHPPSASCDRSSFALTRSGNNIDLPGFGRGHSNMSDQAAARLLSPSTPPATPRSGPPPNTRVGNEPRMERPRSPCEMRESLRQVERAQGEVRKPKCQRMEG